MVEMELGNTSQYESTYNPNNKKLYPISRDIQRSTLGISPEMSFVGYDVWNHYEVSWLNLQGKPMVATAVFYYSSDSKNIVESKSLKLYFNTLNNTRFESVQALTEIVTCDLTQCVGAPVSVQITLLGQEKNSLPAVAGGTPIAGTCLDDLDITIDEFKVNPEFLVVGSNHVAETVYSNLLKSNCLVTGQPDWGTIWIKYKGSQISHTGLLQYIVSFRDHNEFHEHCVERIFVDIMRRCHPEELTVGARYTRRGGVDINPVRSMHPQPIYNDRQIRQ